MRTTCERLQSGAHRVGVRKCGRLEELTVDLSDIVVADFTVIAHGRGLPEGLLRKAADIDGIVIGSRVGMGWHDMTRRLGMNVNSSSVDARQLPSP